jgi:hypothetical protein
VKNFIGENGGILAVLGICAVIGGAYIEWRIAVNVSDTFEAASQVEPHRMDRAEEDIVKLEATDEKLDGKIERIVQILLEE